MTHFTATASIATPAPANKGIAREWVLCSAFGISRTKHDNCRYDKGSDIELPDGRNISVKFGGFSLMCGSLCEGRNTMDSIWELYESRTHSNCFAYVSEAYDVFLMTLAEFKEFVFTFGSIQYESAQNGGQAKIKCNAETKKRIAWLMARVTA